MASRLIAGLIVTLALSACASAEPEDTTPTASAQSTAQSGTMGAPPANAAPNVAARDVAAPPPARTATADNDAVVVPGARQRQVPAPNGDPRSTQERMEDIRAWDTCVMRVQGQAESNPNRPALDTPEDLCRRSLGMNDRLAVPASRAP